MTYFWWWLTTYMYTQNFLNVSQSAVELLRYVKKIKMAAAAILNYYFVIPPTKSACGEDVALQISC